MASQTISYRLTEAEVELLLKFRLDNEKSISLTAQRLLKEAIGLSASEQKNTPIDNLQSQIEELKSQLIELSAKLPA